MKSSGEQNFESATMSHVNALFQTALQLTEDRAAAEELVTEVCSHAWKSIGRRHRLADWRSTLFKILIERARRRSVYAERRRWNQDYCEVQIEAILIRARCCRR